MCAASNSTQQSKRTIRHRMRLHSTSTCSSEVAVGVAVMKATGGVVMPGSAVMVMQAGLAAGIAVCAGADAADGAGVGHGSAQGALKARCVTHRL